MGSKPPVLTPREVVSRSSWLARAARPTGEQPNEVLRHTRALRWRALRARILSDALAGEPGR